jgi:hypothetical protein
MTPSAETQRDWIPISPPTVDNPPPANWDIRNDLYDDVLIVPNPEPGVWMIRTRYFYQLCRDGDNPTSPQDTSQLETDFMMNLSVQSTIQLEGRFLGLNHNQGKAGDTVPVVGTLLQRTGTITGAVVAAAIDKPGTTDYIVLLDDGQHDDGKANDGIYGWPYSLTTVGGSYNVRMVALFIDPADPNNTLVREWNGGFWIDGPELDDPDDDGMPSDWERRCKLDPNVFDAQGDLDRDDLSNIDELFRGTIPCDPDTDNGGENDGSEVANQRNPLWPNDDNVRPLGIVTLRPLNSAILIGWTRQYSYTNMLLYISTDREDPGKPVDMGQTGNYTATQLTNDQTYFLWFQGVNDGAVGPISQPESVTPKADPDPPSGWVLIENGAEETSTREVTLYISSSDIPPDGAIQGANAHMTDRLSLVLNQITGDVEMRISNDPALTDAAWEPLAPQKEWTLQCAAGEVCTVYAQFRDGADNVSQIVDDQIIFDATFTYLPLITK